jgi:hypothetical protein
MSAEGTSDYLVISRGQWDGTSSKQDIQTAIDEFYLWLNRAIDEGRMKMGSRLANEGATVSKDSIVTDGPYGEGKEVIGGYWWIVAASLNEAAQIAAENPCLKHGLVFEIRPTDPEVASAFKNATESPHNQ